MSDDVTLKPCPFCGQGPVTTHSFGEIVVWCVNGACDLCDTEWLDVDAWNRRPVEDALLARAEAAEAERDALIAEVARLRGNVAALLGRVERVEQERDVVFGEVVRLCVCAKAAEAERDTLRAEREAALADAAGWRSYAAAAARLDATMSAIHDAEISAWRAFGLDVTKLLASPGEEGLEAPDVSALPGLRDDVMGLVAEVARLRADECRASRGDR